MKRHTQTILHVPGESVGDCWRTAIACLLDIEDPIDVPHFVELHPEAAPNWWRETVRFVEEQRPGQTLGSYAPEFPIYVEGKGEPYVILGGKSPRGVPHVVIADALTGDVVWDPHPDRSGLVTRTHAYALTARADS